MVKEEVGGGEGGSGGKGKEGRNLLGKPTFKKLDNGRFKCVQTGHEVPSHAKESYAQSKHCRLGLIDAALARRKPPLNMFYQDPLSRSKLICELTGVIVNKSEEHIWKHMNGKHFLSMLEKKEAETETANGIAEQGEQTPEKISKPKADNLKKKKNKKKQEENVNEVIPEVKNSSDKDSNTEQAEQTPEQISKPKADGLKKKKNKKKQEENVNEVIPEVKNSSDKDSNTEQGEQTPEQISKPKADGLKKKKNKKKQEENVNEVVPEVKNSSDKDSNTEEVDFWMPPVGDRWDFDDGGDRWGSDSESGSETEDANGADAATEEGKDDAGELSKRTKRMSIEIGPSNYASRKKKNKTKPT